MSIKLLAFLFFSALTIGFCRAQDSLGFNWQKKTSHELGSEEVWTVDGFSNFYFSHNGILEKIDASGTFKFSQSIKSLGKTNQIVAINTMKILQFSEEQQRICYFDNTLTSLGDCIELGDLNIVYGSMITASNQPDKVWIIDNINSKLILLSLQSRNQGQEIGNLGGVLQITNISQIIERNNKLYLLDSTKGIYVFDLYGSLLEYREEKDIRFIDAHENSLFMLSENELKIVMLNTDDKLKVTLPIKGVREFLFKNHEFYLRTNSHVHKYSLQIK